MSNEQKVPVISRDPVAPQDVASVSAACSAVASYVFAVPDAAVDFFEWSACHHPGAARRHLRDVWDGIAAGGGGNTVMSFEKSPNGPRFTNAARSYIESAASPARSAQR